MNLFRTRFLLPVSLIAIGAVGYFSFFNQNAVSATPKKSASTPLVSLTAAQVKPLPLTLIMQGHVVPLNLVDIQAQITGTVKSVAFTVISILLSLVAVFIPIFLMPGTMGLLFHEFAWVVALAAQRNHGLSPHDAIIQACMQRFRPIMMTTLCAMIGVLPIALGLGAGAELRQPMGGDCRWSGVLTADYAVYYPGSVSAF